MLADLKEILKIQELDIKMIRLARLKKQRRKELSQVLDLSKELHQQLQIQEKEIAGYEEETLLYERKVDEHKERIHKLEQQQNSTRKLDEFNAITKEITTLEREKNSFEQALATIEEKKATEGEVFESTKASLAASDASGKELGAEIIATIKQINEEGAALKAQRDELAALADPSVLQIYDRLLRNKKDRVIVPLVNRICSGCHITLTAQHENVVRKEEKLAFCEHCSRIHFWSEETTEAGETTTKRRRRRALTT